MYCPTSSALAEATSAPAGVTANAEEPSGPPVSVSYTALTLTLKLNAVLPSTAAIAGLTGMVTCVYNWSTCDSLDSREGLIFRCCTETKCKNDYPKSSVL